MSKSAHDSDEESLPPERFAEARLIVHEYSMWAMAAGMLPLAAVDLALVGAAQLRMLARLSALYGLPFSENAVRAIVAALLSSLGAGALKQSVAGQMIKAVPFIGPVLGMMTLPGFAMAFTYAVGRVFIEHFESGGTFLTFNVEAARDRLRSEFADARARRSFGSPAAVS